MRPSRRQIVRPGTTPRPEVARIRLQLESAVVPAVPHADTAVPENSGPALVVVLALAQGRVKPMGSRLV